MKHLKTFNESNDNLKDIVQELKDIALELTDEGFRVDIYQLPANTERFIKIRVDILKIHGDFYRNYTIEDFQYQEISETTDRMIRYMESIKEYINHRLNCWRVKWIFNIDPIDIGNEKIRSLLIDFHLKPFV